jgi:hypothetical protein
MPETRPCGGCFVYAGRVIAPMADLTCQSPIPIDDQGRDIAPEAWRERAEKAERRITGVHAIAEEAAAMRYTGGPGDAALPPEAVLGRRILAALDDSQEADRGC